MTTTPRAMGSQYIEWAKLHAPARFNLATSGVTHFPLRELRVTLDELEISGTSLYGYEPLLAALAKKCEVDPDCIVAAVGTSQANHLAMATLLAPGDEVLLEHPTYAPMLGLASHLGAGVKRFYRRRETGFRIDPAEIERTVTSRTKLIILTNLHNPTGAFTDKETLREVGQIARRIGARVLVDEVYLEMLALPRGPATTPDSLPPFRSAFHFGREFVVTSSLTKAYGLSGLRCGWILAEPDLARKMWRLNDLFNNIPAHPAERLSVIALSQLDKIARRAASLLASNRTLLDQFLDSQPNLNVLRPPGGTIVFPGMTCDVPRFCALLREKYETAVVPGAFFEMPEHVRVGIGGDTAMVAEGLTRLDACLREG